MDSVARLRESQSELAGLFKKVDQLRERALHTEQSIMEMTADIKRLDHTKRNLTLSMTALKRLQMLTTAYEQLGTLSRTRQYKECAQLLQAVLQLMAHFKTYRSIDQIATLGRKVAELQRELLDQVCEDFEDAFTKHEVHQRRKTLAEGSQVMDALGENAKARLVTWYCNTSLREYRQIFRGSDEAGSLDNISRRYAWFSRMLKTYDHDHASLFPPHWRVNEMLANSFCQSTRDDFKSILQRSARREDGQSLDVGLLLSCLQETLDFEHGLEKRFADPRQSFDTVSSADEKPKAFEQAISEAFEPYLSLWVEARDKHLSQLIPKYRQQPVRNAEEDFHSQLVLPSSTELFQVYRLDLAQCAKMSTGSRLLQLSQTFAKYLDQYSQQVLFHFLGERPGPQGPPVEDVIILLNTADYCYMTCNQLEEKIRSRIDDDFRDSVDLQSQADAFMGIAGAAVRALVRKVEIDCEPWWREMRNAPWGRMENVGDQSGYVGELLKSVRSRCASILQMLQHKQQYARAFCDNLVEALTNTYIANIALCRPISEVGAEQMLLDAYALKKALIDLPQLVSEKPQPPQPAYAKRVAQTLSKIDPILKTLQVRPDPAEALVQAYLIHIADRSEANFRTVLELKGIPRKDHTSMVELFNAHKTSQTETLASSSALIANLPMSGQTHTASSVASTPSTVQSLASNKFDAGAFGSALFHAAKDGVDRLGTPVPAVQITAVSSAGPSRMATPPVSSTPVFGGGEPHPATLQPNAASANLNDNLKNLGKFFKRDMSGFGRFGSKQNNDGH